MLALKPLTMIAALATSTLAQNFHLTNFRSADIYIPSSKQTSYIAFTVSNPTAVFEQGGPGEANCSITWTPSTPPPCWTLCSGGGWTYYTRVCSASYEYAGNFTLEVAEYGAYRNSVLNSAHIAVVAGENDYGCSRGAQSTQCNYRNGDSQYDVEFKTTYGPVAQEPAPKCGA